MSETKLKKAIGYKRRSSIKQEGNNSLKFRNVRLK